MIEFESSKVQASDWQEAKKGQAQAQNVQGGSDSTLNFVNRSTSP